MLSYLLWYLYKVAGHLILPHIRLFLKIKRGLELASRGLEKAVAFIKARFKVGLSPSKKNGVICFIESPLKMMKNAFYFILKALFVLKIFKFLS